jgi:hypothetical protein
MIWQSLVIFAVYTALDMLYALYTMDIVSRKPMRAANVGALLYLLIAYGTTTYVKNPWYIVPAVLGSWLGTYVVVKWKK